MILSVRGIMLELAVGSEGGKRREKVTEKRKARSKFLEHTREKSHGSPAGDKNYPAYSRIFDTGK